jgi:hypothetical protein
MIWLAPWWMLSSIERASPKAWFSKTLTSEPWSGPFIPQVAIVNGRRSGPERVATLRQTPLPRRLWAG